MTESAHNFEAKSRQRCIPLLTSRYHKEFQVDETTSSPSIKYLSFLSVPLYSLMIR